ncbi:hypothetical protein [Bradyrhizobium arachidis]|uniref:hypothetical protein n=1 Tax=Bradyrhizobium arachidis TaxID=858423 RepID=UPI0008EB6F8A|nr:hypothetical protein [Bradyrhizobium arachidis]SFV19303.1 hypothetical protein SAMN05192541_14851 [Bradyrhizobium arachidis]
MTTVELLAEMIGTLPADEDTEAALDFLGQPDLIRIVPAAEEANVASAQHWLRIYKIRQATTTEAGIVTRGFPLLLSALEKLHPTELVAVTVFAAPQWYGSFWSDQDERLVGFVLVERRSPEEEQKRLEWFRRNLT